MAVSLDEMHTALMEASMDGHVEVAKLLLDHGAEVNMPADSFESPLTLAACGGHVELAMLLIERGANLEEVNDEGYTPLMEASREGHEEMVALLLSQGADINAQTEETQETALTLACCGGFLEVRYRFSSLYIFVYSVEDYSSRMLSCVVSNFKHGITSKRGLKFCMVYGAFL